MHEQPIKREIYEVDILKHLVIMFCCLAKCNKSNAFPVLQPNTLLQKINLLEDICHVYTVILSSGENITLHAK